jgi:Tfp pilus assembly protein PilP
MQAKKSSHTILINFSNVMFLFFISISTLLIFNSCSEKTDESAQVQPKAPDLSKKNIAEKQKNDQSPPPVQDVYIYNPNGKVDPFVPILSDSIEEESPQKNTGDKKVAQEVPMSPLQKLDVNDFILVAVLSTPKGLCALLEDPAMNGFIIKEGMQIGRKAGVVRKILGSSVLIEEQNAEVQGSSEKKIITLTLRKK